MSAEPIITDNICPPIPDRRWDWIAYRDPEGLNGYGRTERDAVLDLLELEGEEIPEPCSELAERLGCTCHCRFAHSTSIEPPEPRISRDCPLHGADPDVALLRQIERRED